MRLEERGCPAFPEYCTRQATCDFPRRRRFRPPRHTQTRRSESSGKAVFLSEASQDAAVVARIAEALREGGMEVWLDEEGGPVGGDAWDRKSHVRGVRAARLHQYAVTQGRLFPAAVASRGGAGAADGQRRPVHRAGKSRTSERGALVPDAFLGSPWTKLPGGEAPAASGARVKKLLALPEVARSFHPLSAPNTDPGSKVWARRPRRRPATQRLQSLSRPAPQPIGSTKPVRAASNGGRLRRWLRSCSRRGLPSRILASRRCSHRRPFASR